MFRVKTSSTSGQMLTISEYDWLNRSVYNTQGDHSPDNVKFPDNFMIFPWQFAALLPIICVTHIMLILVLLSVVGVGMQQCMMRNRNEMHKFSKSRMDANTQLKINSFKPFFPDKIFSLTFPYF